MGIYIKGMEMPKNGKVIAIYKLQGEFYASANGTELCPLIELPPHGRLIDADALDFGTVFVGASDFAQDCRDGAQSVVDIAPTIIEAEVDE